MADFFDEVRDDLKRERLENLFRKYGPYFAALLLFIVLGTAVISWYNNYAYNSAAETGVEFEQALQAQQENKGDATILLDEVISDGTDGYKELAALKKAAMLEEKKDFVSAIDVYDKIAADSGANLVFRDLATLRSAVILVEYGKNPELENKYSSLDVRISSISATDRPWRYSATELSAILALKEGNIEKALEIFNGLAEDDLTPPMMKERVSNLAKIISNENKS